MVQLSHPHMTTGKTIAMTSWTFFGNVMSLLFNMLSRLVMGFPHSSVGKETACSAGDLGLTPKSGRSPWRKKSQSTPLFLPRESHGQKSLAGYSPWITNVGHDLVTKPPPPDWS